jgi:hypothetical protein
LCHPVRFLPEISWRITEASAAAREFELMGQALLWCHALESGRRRQADCALACEVNIGRSFVSAQPTD